MLAARRDHGAAPLGERGLEPVDFGGELFGRRQRGALLRRLGDALLGLGAIPLETPDRVLDRVEAVDQRGVDRGEPVARFACLVELGGRRALGGARRGLGRLGLGGALLGGLGGAGGLVARRLDGRDDLAELGEPRPLGQPRRGGAGRAGQSRETVPAPQIAGAGDQALAGQQDGLQRAPGRGVGDHADQAQPARQRRRRRADERGERGRAGR